MKPMVVVLILCAVCSASPASLRADATAVIEMKPALTPVRTSRVFQKAFGPNPRGG